MRDLLLALRLDAWVLPALAAWPAAGALLTWLIGRPAGPPTGEPDAASRHARATYVAVLVVEALLAVALWAVFDPGVTGWQAAFDVPLVARWGARLSLGVDGLSLLLVLLAALLLPLAAVGSWRRLAAERRAHHASMLLLTSGTLGVLLARDLLLLGAFWLTLVLATHALVRRRAGWRYLALAGSTALLMLAAVGLLWLAAGSRTFDLDQLLAATRGSLSAAGQLYLFGAFVLAFAAGGALFPLHGWLARAQRGAPADLAAALGVAVGPYGILRFALPFFPTAATHPTLRLAAVALAIVGLVYCALVAARERAGELERVVAYAAVGHLGLVLLGVAALDVESVQGAMLAMLAHGLSFGAAHVVVGMVRERLPGGTRTVGDLAGIGRRAPVLAAAVALAAAAAVGVPGTNGFVGTLLVVRGAYRAYPVAAVIAAATVATGAGYALRALRRLVRDGPGETAARSVADLGARERVVLGALVAAIVWPGVAPGPLLRRTEGAARRVVEQVTRGAAAAPVEATWRDGAR